MPYLDWISAGFAAGLSAFAFTLGLCGPLAFIGFVMRKS